MTTVSDLLNRVWSAFRSGGIADDLTIIDMVGRLLLEDNLELRLLSVSPHRLSNEADRFFSDVVLPRAVKQLGVPRIIDIWNSLREAADQAGSPASLFDRYVLFRLPTMLPGGRYPTPRHIVLFMLSIAAVDPTHRLGDFACGSGGFLVHRPLADQSTSTIGIEISPEWAELARHNARLHRQDSEGIKDSNAFELFTYSSDLLRASFDRILMNPPFGEKIDTRLAEIALDYQKTGSRSETALTALALRKLAPGGRAAILVPSGLLFSNSTADRSLRIQLIADNALEAVISFPKEAFQPYSTVQTTYLLLFSKILPVEEQLTWFFQVEQDGYPSGRGRDLTQEPSRPSDLPFIERIFLNLASDFERQLPNEEHSIIGVRKIMDGTTLLGFLCRGISTELTSIDFYPEFFGTTPPLPPLLLVETVIAEQRFCIQVPLDGDQKPSPVQDRASLVRERKRRKSDADPGTRLLSRPVKIGAIAIAPVSQAATIPRARLLGVAIQSAAIRDETLDLRPEHYIGKQEESRVTDSPTQLLAGIYRNQRELSRRIDSLFGRLELPPIARQQIPSPLVDLEPFGSLSQEQMVIWEKVRKKIAPINSDQLEEELTALHFTPQDVDTSETEEVSDTTQRTLELLERMGVVVSVTVADPNTGEPIALYRRVTERDLWLLDSGASESRGNSS